MYNGFIFQLSLLTGQLVYTVDTFNGRVLHLLLDSVPLCYKKK